MSTRGFIAIKSNGRIVGTYNHSDSYPGWLGVRMVEFIQKTDLDALAPDILLVGEVDESRKPTPGQLADLKARGFWQDVSEGDDWYAALRGAQGNLAAYIEAGYIPAAPVQQWLDTSDVFIEWGYVVDLDASALEVYEMGDERKPMLKRITLTFDEIRAEGFDGQGVMTQIEEASQ